MPRSPRDPEAVTGRRREGAAILVPDFQNVLTRFAQGCGDAAVSAVAARLAVPLLVAVSGRAGVGRTTLSRALAGAGIRTALAGDGPEGSPDVAVVVIAEAVKPEDQSSVAAWRDAGVPVLVVRNKADLAGRIPADALRGRLVDVPVEPAVALLAAVDLDHEMLTALRTLAAHPADLRSVDAFLDTAHPLPGDMRLRLLRALDRRGIAHSVRLLREGADPLDLPALLRELSAIHRVLDRIDALAAPVRYRRVREALTELQGLAAGNDRLAEFLAGDDAVLAAMTAAVDVVESAGMEVDPGDDAAAHLRRAVRWRRYGRGPVSPLHRACAADIARGSLRLFERHR